MKPLPVAAVTDEDYEVLTFKALKRPHQWQFCLCNRSISSDRRDAALMLRAQMHVHFYGGDEYGHGKAELDGIAICGQRGE